MQMMPCIQADSYAIHYLLTMITNVPRAGTVPTDDDQTHLRACRFRSRYGSRSNNAFPSTCQS